MPTGNNKDKRTTSGTKNTGTKNKNSDAGLVNSMPPIPKARDRAKAIDFNRRGDAESNEL